MPEKCVEKIILSSLGHTWILDLDGSFVLHNGYKINGNDSFLPGAKEFLSKIPSSDMVIFLTSRKKEYADLTEKFLNENGIHYNHIIYEAPYGERILINDRKPSGLNMSIGINTNRDEFCQNIFEIDDSL